MYWTKRAIAQHVNSSSSKSSTSAPSSSLSSVMMSSQSFNDCSWRVSAPVFELVGLVVPVCHFLFFSFFLALSFPGCYCYFSIYDRCLPFLYLSRSSSDDMPFSRLGSSTLVSGFHGTSSAQPSYFNVGRENRGTGLKELPGRDLRSGVQRLSFLGLLPTPNGSCESNWDWPDTEGSWHGLHQDTQLRNCAISNGLRWEDDMDGWHARNRVITAQVELTRRSRRRLECAIAHRTKHWEDRRGYSAQLHTEQEIENIDTGKPRIYEDLSGGIIDTLVFHNNAELIDVDGDNDIRTYIVVAIKIAGQSTVDRSRENRHPQWHDEDPAGPCAGLILKFTDP